MKRETLVELARQYADRVRERFGPVTVLLYGSVARGDFNLWSDTDVLVVSDGLPDNPISRSKGLQSLAEGQIEPKGYSLREFRAARDRNHPFVRDLAGHCIVLRDDLDLAGDLRRACDRCPGPPEPLSS